MNVLDILNKLAETSSRKEKEAILIKNKNNRDLKEAFRLALDSRICFYITPESIDRPKSHTAKLNLTDAMMALGELSSRRITGNTAKAYVNKILEGASKNDAEVLVRILDKNLACGVSDSTVNKIWKSLVFSWPCMLASKNDVSVVEKVPYPAIVQVKMDGMRFVAIANPNNGEVDYRSRNGKYMDVQTGNLNLAFVALAREANKNGPTIFDGELLIIDPKTGEPLDRKTGNGILNKSIKGTISEEEKARVRAIIWDILPAADFYKGKSDTPYETRLKNLNKTLKKALPKKFQNQTVRMIDSHLVNSLEEAEGLFQQYLALGNEGILLKDRNGSWEDKRVKHQVKFKSEKECDLICVDWQEGTGKHKGLLGSVLLESSDGKIKVSVGSGFSDHMRRLKKKDVDGKIFAIKYNERIKSKNRTESDSLFLPVILEIREDKKRADSSKDIK
jgi:ATP-dependent DNA ligase